MAVGDIPVFREARRGQVVRSDDWNAVQRELRNGIRTHRHLRISGIRFNDDGSDQDLAFQIATDEIADGAVTQAKLGSGIFDSLVEAAQLGLTGNGQTGGDRQVFTDVVPLTPLGRERVEHGFGRVPVAVMVGVRQRVNGLDGDFDVYGALPQGGTVIAAVPVEPDGTFTLVSSVNARLSVRWWALAGGTVAIRTARRDVTDEAPTRAPRRARSSRARGE